MVTLQQFLVLMEGDLQNEWTHLQFYLYHASAVMGLHAHEYKEFLTEAAAGELQHVQQFLDRLFGLHVKPLATSGKQFPIFTDAEDILKYAILLETEVANNYAYRLTQLEALAEAYPTQAAYLTIFFEDQLKDSYEDCEKMRRILAKA
jgi:bacterioferritin (cytochrome b1)